MSETIIKMLAAFPGERSDETIGLFLDLATEHPAEVVEETCQRFITAKIKRNHSFAPSVPEFVDELRKIAEWQEAKNTKPEPIKIVPNVPLEDRLFAYRRKFTGRDLIEDGVSHQRFMEGCARHIWPKGASYCAALGSVYAPHKGAA